MADMMTTGETEMHPVFAAYSRFSIYLSNQVDSDMIDSEATTSNSDDLELAESVDLPIYLKNDPAPSLLSTLLRSSSSEPSSSSLSVEPTSTSTLSIPPHPPASTSISSSVPPHPPPPIPPPRPSLSIQTHTGQILSLIRSEQAQLTTSHRASRRNLEVRFEKTKVELEGKIRELDVLNEASLKESDGLKKENGELKGMKVNFEKTKEDLEGKIGELEGLNEVNLKELVELKKENGELRGELEGMKVHIKKTKGELEAKIRGLEGSNKVNLRESDRLEKENGELKADLGKMKEGLEGEIRELEGLRDVKSKELDGLEAENGELRGKLEGLKVHYKKMKEGLKGRNRVFEASSKANLKNSEELKKENGELRGELEDLKVHSKRTKEELDGKISELERMKEVKSKEWHKKIRLRGELEDVERCLGGIGLEWVRDLGDGQIVFKDGSRLPGVVKRLTGQQSNAVKDLGSLFLLLLDKDSKDALQRQAQPRRQVRGIECGTSNSLPTPPQAIRSTGTTIMHPFSSASFTKAMIRPSSAIRTVHDGSSTQRLIGITTPYPTELDHPSISKYAVDLSPSRFRPFRRSLTTKRAISNKKSVELREQSRQLHDHIPDPLRLALGSNLAGGAKPTLKRRHGLEEERGDGEGGEPLESEDELWPIGWGRRRFRERLVPLTALEDDSDGGEGGVPLESEDKPWPMGSRRRSRATLPLPVPTDGSEPTSVQNQQPPDPLDEIHRPPLSMSTLMDGGVAASLSSVSTSLRLKAVELILKQFLSPSPLTSPTTSEAESDPEDLPSPSKRAKVC